MAKWSDYAKLGRELGKSTEQIFVEMITLLDGEISDSARDWLLKKDKGSLEDISSIIGSKVLTEEELDKRHPHKEIHFFDYDSKKDRHVPLYNSLAHYMADKYNYFSTETEEYIYRDHHYVPIGKTHLGNIIQKLTKEQSTPPQSENFKKKLRELNYKEEVEFNPTGKLNLANGVYNVKKAELEHHSPENIFTYKLPHCYDPNATCPKFKEFFLRQTEDPNSLEMFFEFLGYTLEGGPQYKQKILAATGERDTGKSTLLKVTQWLLGSNNYSSVNLKDLGHNFRPIAMLGKLANIVDEIPNKGIDSQIFKAITGGGTITVEQKNKPAFSTPINAKFIVSANGFIKFDSSTHSEALIKRLLYIQFKRIVPDAEKKDGFEESFKPELPGILNEAIAGLARLKRNGQFTVSQATLQLNERARKDNDTVYDFLEENITLSKELGSNKPIKVIFNEYVADCLEARRHPVGRNEFYSRLERWAKLKSVSFFGGEKLIIRPNNNKKLKFVKSPTAEINVMLN